MCDSVCCHIRQQLCNVRCTDLHAAEDETVLKRVYDRLAELCLDSLPRLYSGTGTATDSTFNRHELLCNARWDSVSCPVSCLCTIPNLAFVANNTGISAAGCRLGCTLTLVCISTNDAVTYLSMRPHLC